MAVGYLEASPPSSSGLLRKLTTLRMVCFCVFMRSWSSPEVSSATSVPGHPTEKGVMRTGINVAKRKNLKHPDADDHVEWLGIYGFWVASD